MGSYGANTQETHTSGAFLFPLEEVSGPLPQMLFVVKAGILVNCLLLPVFQ